MSASSYLSQEQANEFIAMLKNLTSKHESLRGQGLRLPAGKGKIFLDVEGDTRDDQFVISLDRKGISAESFTYQGRTVDHNIVLIRVDLTPTGRHLNPNGDLILGPHIHIYCEGYGDKCAIPYQPDDDDFVSVCLDFFRRFNLVNIPRVSYQTGLLNLEVLNDEATRDD